MVIGDTKLSVDFGNLSEQGWVGPALTVHQLAGSGQQIRAHLTTKPAFAAARRPRTQPDSNVPQRGR
jgi:hypothetical protein